MCKHALPAGKLYQDMPYLGHSITASMTCLESGCDTRHSISHQSDTGHHKASAFLL